VLAFDILYTAVQYLISCAKGSIATKNNKPMCCNDGFAVCGLCGAAPFDCPKFCVSEQELPVPTCRQVRSSTGEHILLLCTPSNKMAHAVRQVVPAVRVGNCSILSNGTIPEFSDFIHII
jgi:hypothetical protein